ncbi:MAG: hypothetical protein QNJ97_00105 [Myxococcota bacterium]|nr:hypothetical protein [Myxococcota bacterium]
MHRFWAHLLINSWVFLFAAGAIAQTQAGTQPPEPEVLPRHRLVYSNLLAFRYNPLGLEDRISLGYRFRLYNDSNLLWRDAHIGLAFTPTINPATTRIGGTLTVKPIAVLSLSAGYYFVAWHGTFDYLYSTDSATDDFSDSAIENPEQDYQGYSTTGQEAQFRAQAVGKVGPVVLRNDLIFFYGNLDLKGGDSLYYHSSLDALVPNSGWALTNDSDLVYLSDFGLIVGVRNSVVHAFYKDEHYGPSDDTENINTPTVRVGPLAAYVFYDRPSSWFNRPTLVLIVNWWLKHRFRTGDDVNQGIPYLVLGFRFDGDIWHRR